MKTKDRDSWVATAFDVLGQAADVAGTQLGGPVAVVAAAVKLITAAVATAIRDQGRSVADIIESIRMPPELDTSFQSEVDRLVAEKPKRSPP